MTGNSWLDAILIGSIVVPLGIAVAVVLVLFNRSKNDPDQERLKRAQQEYRARQGR